MIEHRGEYQTECADAVLYFGACDHADAAEAACGCKAFASLPRTAWDRIMLDEDTGLLCGPAGSA